MYSSPNRYSPIIQNLCFERDSYTCALCTCRASELHHIVPRSQGGHDTPHNLVSLCRIHHLVIHGERIAGERMTRLEAQQAVVEYIQDYYAEEIARGTFWWAG